MGDIDVEGLPRNSQAGLGAGGPEFKSRRPDQTSVGAMTYRREIFALLHFGTTWKQQEKFRAEKWQQSQSETS